MMKIEFDDGITAELTRLERALPEITRPAAQAGAQVLYEAVLSNINDSKAPHVFVSKGKGPASTRRRYLFFPGSLRRSIYQAYSRDNSTDSIQEYHISWRKKKGNAVPYAHMLEFGTSRMAARPFLRPAYDAAQPEALQAAERTLHQKLSEVAHV